MLTEVAEMMALRSVASYVWFVYGGSRYLINGYWGAVKVIWTKDNETEISLLLCGVGCEQRCIVITHELPNLPFFSKITSSLTFL